MNWREELILEVFSEPKMEGNILPILDYDSELIQFSQEKEHNRTIFLNSLTSCNENIKDYLVTKQTLYRQDKDKVVDIEARIESFRESIKNIVSSKDHAGRVYQQLTQEFEQIEIDLDKKLKDKNNKKELLEEVNKHLNEKERIANENEQNRQKKIRIAEKALALYTMHLGLRIEVSKTQQQTILFIFTQINKANPNQEFKIEIEILENDNYHIKNSVPQLLNLEKLEDRLNQTNNWRGFVIHIRQLFKESLKC